MRFFAGTGAGIDSAVEVSMVGVGASSTGGVVIGFLMVGRRLVAAGFSGAGADAPCCVEDVVAGGSVGSVGFLDRTARFGFNLASS